MRTGRRRCSRFLAANDPAGCHAPGRVFRCDISARCQWLFLPPLRDELLLLFAILAERSLLYPLSRSASYFLSFLTLLPCFLAIASSESCDRILNAR